MGLAAAQVWCMTWTYHRNRQSPFLLYLYPAIDPPSCYRPPYCSQHTLLLALLYLSCPLDTAAFTNTPSMMHLADTSYIMFRHYFPPPLNTPHSRWPLTHHNLTCPFISSYNNVLNSVAMWWEIGSQWTTYKQSWTNITTATTTTTTTNHHPHHLQHHHQQTDSLTERLIKKVTDWLIVWLTDWVNEWLDWIANARLPNDYHKIFGCVIVRV